MNRKKVLFIIESLAGGGAEKALTTLLRNCDRSKFDITICCIVNTGKYTEEVQRLAKYTYIIPNWDDCKTLWQRLKYQMLYKLIYSLLPLNWVYSWFIPKGNDIEIAFVEGFATKLLSKARSNTKKIAWVHCDLVNHHWISSIYRDINEERLSYEKFDNVIGVSESASQAITTLYGNNVNITTIYNPVDATEIINKSIEATPTYNKSKDNIRICSIGRFVQAKAFDRLLRIINRLRDEGIAVELWILGDGQLRPEYEEYIAQNNLQQIVTLWGFQSNPYSYLSQCDIFACSSITEGYSLVIAEAIVLGIPIISTNCAGPAELLADSKYGILVDNDEESLYHGLKKMVTDSEFRNQYVQQPLETSKFFDIKLFNKKIESILSTDR